MTLNFMLMEKSSLIFISNFPWDQGTWLSEFFCLYGNEINKLLPDTRFFCRHGVIVD